MNANLVGAPCVEIRLNEGERAKAQPHTPIRARLAAFSAARGHARTPVQVARYGQINGSRFSFDLSMQQCDINFPYLPLPKFLNQLAVSGVVQGDDQRAGSFFIEPMNNAGTQRSANIGKAVDSPEAMQKSGNEGT